MAHPAGPSGRHEGFAVYVEDIDEHASLVEGSAVPPRCRAREGCCSLTA